VKLIVAITGASGVIYGKRFLEVLKERQIETHLIVTDAAEKVAKHELGVGKKDLEKLADHIYNVDDLLAPIVSGSFKTDGMVIIPCSMKTLAGLTSGYTDNLLLRAADVTLKEKRRLLIVPRETPLGPVHLENMAKLSSWGVYIMPACPGFYHLPKSLDDLIDQFVFRIMNVFGLECPIKRWGDCLPE